MSLEINNQESCIKSVPSSKLLGKVIDNNLNWAPHLSQLNCMLNSSLFLLRSLQDKVIPMFTRTSPMELLCGVEVQLGDFLLDEFRVQTVLMKL